MQKEKSLPCSARTMSCKKDCGCPDEISCDKPAVPSTALCPQTGKPDSAEMKQVYGYPQAIYGSNNYVGEPANSIFSTETAMKGCPASRMSSSITGATVATDGQITGAATQMPCLNECPNNTMVFLSTETIAEWMATLALSISKLKIL